MKILFVSSSPLSKEISIGNTFINLFSGMENTELASVYTRAGVPDKEISQAFCITEKMLIRNLIKKTPVGVRVESKETGEAPKNHNTKKEQGIIDFIKTRRWTIFFWLQDFVWRIGKWKSPELKQFIEEYNPDIVFTVLSDSRFLNRLILHVTKISNKKLVLYAWDNNYSLKQFMLSPLRWINHFLNRRTMRKVAKKADLFYVISNIQKKEYEKTFKKECKVLTKSADFSQEAPAWIPPENGIRMMFAGNIGTGRWQSLALISDAVERLTQEGHKIQFDIYTPTPLTKKMKTALQKQGTTLHEPVSYDEILKLQKQAHVLVHAEGLSLKSRTAVHQSFSTKLVDFFAMGKCIFAIGTEDEASIAHLMANDAAVTASSKEEAYQKLKELCANPEMMHRYSVNAYECGRKHHDRAYMQTMVADDLTKAAGLSL